ncbi:polymorphic toxin type 44 domain-containing protein [Chondromyces apiculatus]|uniref:polymorphic toxin type 44 domain-containing protein n=1 Tax=Chondromyces apiculatus TaxID=51 RepID=UPI0035221225
MRSWHTWGEWEYCFDVWSNIHYGYVGRAAGFDRQTLIDGSNRSSWRDTGGMTRLRTTPR